MTTRRLSALLLALLAAPALAPGVTAQGGLIEDLPDDPLPTERPIETTIIPIDNAQDAVLQTGHDAYESASDAFEALVEDTDGALPDEPIVVYADGLGSDGAQGRIGQWRVLGDGVWTLSDQAALHGAWGYASADRPDGTYSLSAASLLVTPELDLRAGNPRGFTLSAPSPINQLNAELWPVLAPFLGITPAPPAYGLEFQQRHNLGTALRDGVQVWLFTQPPTDADVAACVPALCTVLEPVTGGYDAPRADALPAGQAYGSSADWTRTVVDLTPWAETRVWVGLRFGSSEAPLTFDYFHNPAFFDRQDFFGFHLDDVALRVLAPAANVQVHEILSPNIVPPGRTRPTIATTQPLDVETVVRNPGATAAVVDIRVSVQDRTSGAVITGPDGPYEAIQRDVGLPPGASVTVTETFAPLGVNGATTVVVDAIRTDGLPDATEADDRAALDVDVETIRGLRFDPVLPAVPFVLGDQPLTVRTSLRNVGNVPESTTVEARLVDIARPEADVDGLLDASEISPQVAIGPGEAAPLTWTVNGSTPGQYRLFVRTLDQPAFRAADLLPPRVADEVAVATDLVPTVDGVLDDPAWLLAAPHAFALAADPGTSGTRAATMRFAVTDTDLYIAITLDGADVDSAAVADDDETVLLRFDDLADGHLVDGGEDGVHKTGASPAGDAWLDLAYSTQDLAWLAQGDERGAVARMFDAATSEYRYEIRRPLGGLAGAGDLTALPGDDLAWFLRVTKSTPQPSAPPILASWFFPPSAVDQDGQGTNEADGRLDDEVATWRILSLQELIGESVGDRRLSEPFGLGRSPAATYVMDVRDGCPTGWQVSGANNVAGHGVDRWNCGVFEDAGRRVFYEGMAPGSTCGREECPQYSAAQLRDGADVSVLTSPPIALPAVPTPFLVLEHQYATSVGFSDADTIGIASNPGGREMQLSSAGWLSLQVLEEGEWGPDVYLVPSGGYPTEKSNGLFDPRTGPNGRAFATSAGGGHFYFCNPTGTRHSGVAHSCGWWAPTGRVERYRPLDEDLPLGADLHGSPWVTDFIPLFGDHPDDVDGHGNVVGGVHTVEGAGKTVRFRFHYAPGWTGNQPGPLDGFSPPTDLGWRIGAIAVTSAGTFVHDLAIDAVHPDTPYDAAVVGLGPGTSVPVAVTVRNAGLQESDATSVAVRIVDASQGAQLCHAVADVDALQPGEAATVRSDCDLPASADGLTAIVSAAFSSGAADDYAGNDQRSAARPFAIRAAPDARVEVAVTPQVAAGKAIRTLVLQVNNTGNVPLHDFEVQRTVLDDGFTLQSRSWTLHGTLGVGQARLLGDPGLGAEPAVLTKDREFTPPGPGEYEVVGTVLGIPGETDVSDNVARVRFAARETLYSDTFDAPAQLLAPIVTGAPAMLGTDGVWTLMAPTTSRALRAGDPVTGELMQGTDATYVLPELDATVLKGATLTMRTRYDLEPGFDAARVEISTDGGASWRPLSPVQAPLLGRPDGYPSDPLTGDNAMLDGAPAGQAVAFTGSSAMLPDAAPDGSILAEFDLAADPGLRVATRAASFLLDDLAAAPSEIVTIASNEYQTHASWADAEGDVGWMTEDVRRNDPLPHSGGTMWWSGTAGEFTDVRREHVRTDLVLPLPAEWPPARTDLALEWWDWRAGWRDEAARLGTGGSFAVHVTSGADSDDVTDAVRVLEARPDGWTLRMLDLSGWWDESMAVRFAFVSDATEDPQAKTKANDGWFIDDLRLASFNVSQGARVDLQEHFTDDLESLSGAACTHIGPYEAGSAAASAGCWSLVPRSSPTTDAWRVASASGPTGGTEAVWRLAASTAQGYPHRLDARLITPVVDLAAIAGSSASLTFDHRYHFESFRQQETTIAVDGGIVEIQVRDPATGQFGEWRPLFAEEPARLIVLEPLDWPDGMELVPPDGVTRTGYDALLLRGDSRLGSTNGARLGLGAPIPAEAGVCTQCEVANALFKEFPLSYAFSGDSGGWRPGLLDVTPYLGQEVRFAFRAWSNPEYGGAGTLHGWSLANIAIEGESFQGAHALLRLRIATDGSYRPGSWIVDELALVGDRYARNVAVLANETEIRAAPGQPVVLTGRLANLGRDVRPGLAVAVDAWHDGTLEPVTVTLGSPDLAALEPAVLAPGIAAHGPLLLTAGDEASSRPFAASLAAAEDGRSISVRIRLLEDQGGSEIIDGTPVHFPFFDVPRDEVPGNTFAIFHVQSVGGDAARLIPPDDASARTVRIADDNESAHFVVGVLNQGTHATDLKVHWSVIPIAGGDPTASGVETAADVPAGAERVVAWTQALEPGLYHLHADVRAGGGPLDATDTDFASGVGTVAWAHTFDDASALPPGWARSGNDPPQIAFDVQRIPGTLTWGTHPLAVETYCTPAGVCDGGSVGTVGRATTDMIDLRHALNGRAFVALSHSFSFARGDGAQLEATILQEVTPGVWAPRPCAGQTVWVKLDAAPGGAVYDGITRSLGSATAPQVNPLGSGTPVWHGPAGSLEAPTSSVFAMHEQSPWTCPSGSPSSPSWIGNPVGLRLVVGIQDALKAGRDGWHVNGMSASSQVLRLGPREADSTADPSTLGDHVLPARPGAPKRFTLTLTNDGETTEDVLLSILDDPADASDDAAASWLRLPTTQLEKLAPGETRRFPLELSVPADAPGGRAVATLQAQAAGSQTVRDLLRVGLDVLGDALPDLSVTALDVQLEGGVPDAATGKLLAQQGVSMPMHITIANIGHAASPSLPVRVDLIAAGGGVIAIEERDIPPLCPVIECGKNGARHTMSIEAIMPEHPGNYTLRVAIDPAARIIERSRTNNVAEIPVAVVPLQIADVEVSAIRVDGTSAGNFVEDGSLLTVAATIKNVGAAPAHDVLAILLSGSAQLTQLAIPELAVGEARVVQAVKIANARGGDELVFHAVAHVASGRELNEDNNKATIVLRVRSHLLEMAISSPLQSVAPGGRLLVPLTIHNGGNAVDHVTARLDGVPQGWSAALLPQPLLVAPNATTRAVLLVDPSANALRGLHNVSVTLLLPSGATAAALDVPVLVAPNGGEVVLATTPPTLQVGENALLVSIQNAANMDLAGLLHADVPQGWTSAPVELAVSAFATAQRTLRILVPPGAAGAFDVTLRVLGRDDSGGMTSGAADAGVDHATGAGHGGSAGAGMGPSSGAATIRVEVRQTMRGTLSWSDVRGSESADPGLQAAELVGLISNAGNVETAFVLTSEQMPQGVVLDPVTTGPLAPGESEAFTARLLVPAGTFQSTTGRVLVAAVVDDQGHDATSWPLPRLDRRPDLVVEAWSLSPAAGVKPGDALRLTADVTNLGASAAPATRLYAYVDGQLAAVVDVPPLEPDASWAVNLTWTAREPGEHIVTLTADAASEVAEASEDNNGFSSPVSVDRRLLDRVTPTPPVPLLAASLLALALLAANRRRR